MDKNSAKQNSAKISTTSMKELGLHSEKRLATHLLAENSHNNNLLSDIATVDYCKDHKGRTDLQPLEGLSTFVDDLYVYGYAAGEHLVQKGHKLSFTTGERGHTKRSQQAARALVQLALAR